MKFSMYKRSSLVEQRFSFQHRNLGGTVKKNTLYISRLWENSDEQNWDKQNKTKIKGKVDVTYKDKNAHSEV